MGLGGARLVAVAHNFALGLVLWEKNLLQINCVVNLWTIFQIPLFTPLLPMLSSTTSHKFVLLAAI